MIAMAPKASFGVDLLTLSLFNCLMPNIFRLCIPYDWKYFGNTAKVVLS